LTCEDLYDVWLGPSGNLTSHEPKSGLDLLVVTLALVGASSVEQVHLCSYGLCPEQEADKEGACQVVMHGVELLWLLHGVQFGGDRCNSASDGWSTLQELLHLLVGEGEVMEPV
jgi:hypothetical protein